MLFSISFTSEEMSPAVTDDDSNSSVDTFTSISNSLVTSSLPKSKLDSVDVVVVVVAFLGKALSWNGFKKLNFLPMLRAMCEKNFPILN